MADLGGGSQLGLVCIRWVLAIVLFFYIFAEMPVEFCLIERVRLASTITFINVLF